MSFSLDRYRAFLIQPPLPRHLRKEYLSLQIPYNLGLVAKALDNSGARVMLRDFQVEEFKQEVFLRLLSQERPLLVGFTSMTCSLPFVKYLSRLVKQVNSQMVTVLGGVHASALPEETLKSLPHIDFIVLGEGEATIRELFQALAQDQDFRKIKGIAFLDKGSGEFLRTPDRELSGNIDDFYGNVYGHFDLGKYRKKHLSRGFSRIDLEARELFTSRGCSQNCIFCAGHLIYGNSLRFRSLGSIIKEIEEAGRYCRLEHLSIEDDNFTANRQLVRDLGKYLKSKKITWNCNSRVNLIDDDLAGQMAENNCRKVSFGIESGSQRILDLTRKGINIPQVLSAFQAVRRARIRFCEANFMLASHPEENLQDVQLTRELIFKIKPDFLTLSVMCPFPGTPAYQIVQDYGFFPARKNWLNFSLVSPRLPYLRSCHFTAEELLRLRNSILKEYYLSFGYFCRQLKNLRNISELRYFYRLGSSLNRERF